MTSFVISKASENFNSEESYLHYTSNLFRSKRHILLSFPAIPCNLVLSLSKIEKIGKRGTFGWWIRLTSAARGNYDALVSNVISYCNLVDAKCQATHNISLKDTNGLHLFWLFVTLVLQLLLCDVNGSLVCKQN